MTIPASADRPLPAGRRAAVLGRPIAHSRSPVLHRAAYRALGLDWTYDAVDIGEDDLPAFLDSLDDRWIGLSLTMPLKVAVIPLLDRVTSDVEATGAANTVVIGPGGTRTGYNTDIHGITTAIEEALTGAGLDAAATGAVIGSGATARSTVLALQRLGVGRLSITARRPEAAADVVSMAERIGSRAEAIPWSERGEALAADVVVSTLPGDAAAPLAGELEPVAVGRPGEVGSCWT